MLKIKQKLLKSVVDKCFITLKEQKEKVSKLKAKKKKDLIFKIYFKAKINIWKWLYKKLWDKKCGNSSGVFKIKWSGKKQKPFSKFQ